MKKIGITGGIGSGKSMVSRLLAVAGIPVYLTDDRAKWLMDTDEEVRIRLQSLAGGEMYRSGRLDRPALARWLFADENRVSQVNSIVHPAVRTDFRRWAASHSTEPAVAIESAILIEAGFADEVDEIWMVSAPLEVRVARAMQRDHATREQVQARMRHQMSDEEKKKHAHFVLTNDGETPLVPQVFQRIAFP